MNRSTPGLPVHHQLPEFTQTHVHRVSDAIQPSHPLSSPSPPAPNLSQHQSLFQRVNSLHEVAKVLEFQLQHHSFQRNPRADLLQNGLVGSPCSPRDTQESSTTPQFNSINSSALSLLHSPTLCDPIEFSRPEYWSGSPFSSPGDLPNLGTEPLSPSLQMDSLPAEPQEKGQTANKLACPTWNMSRHEGVF